MNASLAHRRLVWAGIALLVVLAYLGGLEAPFVYDDKVEVIGNRTLRMAEDWRTIASYNLSRPLLMFTYAWNFREFGLDPTGYHVTTLVVHILAVGAALFMGDSLGRLAAHPRALLASGIAVATWAVHPMCTEAVIYTTGRSESLCGLFVFLSIGAWAQALLQERAGATGSAWRWVGLLAFGCAVMTKEVGALVPLALLVVEWLWPAPSKEQGRRFRRVRWAWFAGLGLFLVGAAWLRLQHAGTLLHREVDRSLGVQLVTMAEVWLRYLGLWLLPVEQTLFHHQPDLVPGSMQGVGAVLGWCAVVLGGVVLGRRRPLVGLGLVMAALFLLPSSSVVALKENMAEHRSYQSGLYLALALAWSFEGAGLRWALRLAPVAVIAAMVATLARNEVWADEVTLWAEATERRPDVADAWYGLGDAQRFAGQFEKAMDAYGRAVDLDSDHLDAWNNLGIARAELGDHAGATEAWRLALAQSPRYCKAHNNLGMMAYRKKQWDLAIQELRSTLAYCPEDAVAHYGLGNVFYGPRRDRERAVVHFEALLEVAPHFDRAAEVKKRLLDLTF